jgi:hypothetical protein
MARMIEWEGQPLAVLVESDHGAYLVPPIVLDDTGVPVEGCQVLAAIVLSGVPTEHPVIRISAPAGLAEIDQIMARLSDQLGVPIGPPTV